MNGFGQYCAGTRMCFLVKTYQLIVQLRDPSTARLQHP